MIEKICPECGTTLSKFYQTSMLGCPTCYRVFEREITLALKKIQGGTLHAGKTPYETEFNKKLLAEYESLIKQKEIAGIEQRFSDMNDLTAQILCLGDELKSRGLI
jgi:protein-arginine kinase activator protein McsA